MIVKKFGGTSVRTDINREVVAQNIIQDIQAGKQVVVVISAMGRRGDPYATDTILDMISKENPEIDSKNLDKAFTCGEVLSGVMMAAKLQKEGFLATFVSGAKAGIVTDNQHQHANILSVKPDYLFELLNQNIIPIVGGGQGATIDGEVTVLGRGGSDTTACAIGVAMKAEKIEIFSDVVGIMTSDPRQVPDSTIIPKISHQLCKEMAEAGAKIIHPRSVSTAEADPTIPVYVRSTFVDHPGTVISNQLSEPVGKAIALVLDNEQDIIYLDPSQTVPGLEEIRPGVYAINKEWRTDLYHQLANKVFERNQGLYKISLIGHQLATDTMSNFVNIIEDLGCNVIDSQLTGYRVSVWFSGCDPTWLMKTVHGEFLGVGPS